MDIGQSLSCESSPRGSIRPQSIDERLQEEKKRLETRLTAINHALEVLAKHPEVAEVVKVISRL